jgi:ankyrin repeat protein
MGNEELTSFLLVSGSDPNVKNKFNETPLFLAVRARFVSLVSLLLKHGADPNILNQEEQTVLDTINPSAYNYNPELLQVLLSYRHLFEGKPRKKLQALGLRKVFDVKR